MDLNKIYYFLNEMSHANTQAQTCKNKIKNEKTETKTKLLKDPLGGILLSPIFLTQSYFAL